MGSVVVTGASVVIGAAVVISAVVVMAVDTSAFVDEVTAASVVVLGVVCDTVEVVGGIVVESGAF